MQKADTARLSHHGLREGGREHSPLAISHGALALLASPAGHNVGPWMTRLGAGAERGGLNLPGLFALNRKRYEASATIANPVPASVLLMPGRAFAAA